MSRTVKIDLKEDDYFGNITFVDGKLDQLIIQLYPHKERVHSAAAILEALAKQIAAEIGSTSDLRANTEPSRKLASEQEKEITNE